MSALNLDAIKAKWLNVCGPHDYGMDVSGCNCPEGDPRAAISALVTEVERLREANANLLRNAEILAAEIVSGTRPEVSW